MAKQYHGNTRHRGNLMLINKDLLFSIEGTLGGKCDERNQNEQRHAERSRGHWHALGAVQSTCLACNAAHACAFAHDTEVRTIRACYADQSSAISKLSHAQTDWMGGHAVCFQPRQTGWPLKVRMPPAHGQQA